MYLNKVTLYGNLTRDPELKALPSGQQVVSFSIATNRDWKDKDGTRKEATEYHNVVAFGRQAEIIGQYMKKGKPIYIDGRIQTRSWESDGEKKYRTEVIVDNFQFGPSPAATVASAFNEEKSETNVADEEGVPPEDIPF